MIHYNRIETANQILRICASHGRRFFSQDADSLTRMENPRVSEFFVHPLNGRLYYRDKWRGAQIYVHHDPPRRGGSWGWRFSEGGTLGSLCRDLRDWILGKRDTIPLYHFGPWNYCSGDLWGYGEDMVKVRAEALAALETQAGEEGQNG
jgi:hypothetical protein